MSRDSAISLTPRFQLADFAPLISLATLVLVFSVVASDFLSFGTLSLILKYGWPD